MAIKLYTYKDIANLFKVSVATVRLWKKQKQFRILGYRRVGRWAKEAVITEEEVKRLIYKKLIIK